MGLSQIETEHSVYWEWQMDKEIDGQTNGDNEAAENVHV